MQFMSAGSGFNAGLNNIDEWVTLMKSVFKCYDSDLNIYVQVRFFQSG